MFKISDKAAFELPLSNVMRCVGTKSEAILEFHANDECPVQLTEMRLHIPQDPDRDRDNEDPVEVKICANNHKFVPTVQCNIP